MWRYGASAMQPPLDPGDLGVRATCLIGVVFTTPKSPLRFQRLSQRCSMVMRPSSLERWCLSSARKSAVVRLAAGARGVDDVRDAIGECECAT
jgi:hypothetical protein